MKHAYSTSTKLGLVLIKSRCERIAQSSCSAIASDMRAPRENLNTRIRGHLRMISSNAARFYRCRFGSRSTIVAVFPWELFRAGSCCLGDRRPPDSDYYCEDVSRLPLFVRWSNPSLAHANQKTHVHHGKTITLHSNYTGSMATEFSSLLS